MGDRENKQNALPDKRKALSPEVLLREIMLFEASYPLLISFAKAIRERHAAKNKTDRLVEAAGFVSAIEYLCKHNYMLYLLITGNFDEFYKIYYEHLSKSERFLIAYLEKELTKTVNSNDPLFSTLKSNKNSASSSDTIDWSPYVELIPAMALYHSYDAMLKQEFYNYKVIQTQIYYNAIVARTDRATKAIQLIQENPHLSPEEKEFFLSEIRNHLTNLTIHKNSIETSMKQINESNEYDMIAIDKLLIASQKAYDESSGFSDLLKVLNDSNHLSKDIEALYQNDVDGNKSVQTNLGQAKMEHEEHVAEIMPHVEKVRHIAKNDATQCLNEILCIAKNSSKNKLTPDKFNQLMKSLSLLEQWKEKLNKSEDVDLMQTALNHCGKTVRSIETIAKTALSEDEFRALKQQIVLLNQMVFIPQSLSRSKKFMAPFPPSEPYPGDRQEEIKEPTNQSNGGESLNGSNTQTSSITSNNGFAFFKTDDAIDTNEPIDLPPDLQEKLKFIVQNSITKINRLTRDPSLSSDDSQQINQLRKLFQKVKSGGYSQVNPKNLSDIVDTIDSLPQFSAEFSPMKEELKKCSIAPEPTTPKNAI